MKTKPSGLVEIVHNGNDEFTMGDDIFQLGEFVDPYQVGPSNYLKKFKFLHRR